MFLDQGLVRDADIELVEGKVCSWVLLVYFKILSYFTKCTWLG
jgi:hypothetical protein